MKTREIGHAAFALTRFRFARALVGSAFLNVPLIIAMAGGFAVTGYRGVELTLAIILVVALVLATTLGLTIALNVVDRVHRRLVAILSFYLALVLPLAFAYGSLLWATTWSHAPEGQSLRGFVTVLEVGALAVTAFMILLFAELTALAAWATIAPKAAYMSVRGWRPAWSRPVANFTHQLGFPAFASQVRNGRIGLGGLLLLISALNVAFFGVLSAPIWLPRPGWSHDSIVQSLAYLAVPAAAALLLVVGVGRLVDKAVRNRATQLYQGVREWDDRAPILFLRQFDQDKSAIPARTRDPVMQWPAGLGRKRQIDEILLEAGAPFGPVIAIGDPRDPIPPLGAARVFVKNAEENWKNVVADLIAASRVIIICPHTSAGVGWEIEQISAPWLLARTIVLASPDMSAEESVGLFSRIADAEAVLKRGRRPVAAYKHPKDGWTVLSVRRLTMQTYTVALNRALQDVLQATG